MQQILLVIGVVMGQSLLAVDKKSLTTDPIVEKAIRWELKKPTGELTKADLAKVTSLMIDTNITVEGIKELAKMKQLKGLGLRYTKVTKEGMVQLQKALPKCEIDSNPTK